MKTKINTKVGKMLDTGCLMLVKKRIITFNDLVSPPASPEGEADPPAMQGTSTQVAGRRTLHLLESCLRQGR